MILEDGHLKIDAVHQGDCLELMPFIKDKSIDLILCDLPYGSTACKWDQIIPFEPLWKEYKRLIKDRGAIVLTASQPFTSFLITSNIDMFKYCWVWNKKKPGGIGFAKYQPMRITEDVCVFYNTTAVYNPQMEMRDTPRKYKNYSKSEMHGDKTGIVSMDIEKTTTQKYPKNLIEFSAANQNNRMHPTQKPVALFEYLIKTYTNEGDLVLDNCAGSFTTSIAADNTKRKWICIEKERKYCEIGMKRINENRANLRMNLFEKVDLPNVVIDDRSTKSLNSITSNSPIDE